MSKIMLDEVSGLMRDHLEKIAGPNGRKWVADWKRFLRGELEASERARKRGEEAGVFYFSVTSDGTTGKEWIQRLENEGCRVNFGTRNMLRSKDFKPTKGVTYDVAILRGKLFKDSERRNGNIRAEAIRRDLTEINAEAACLIIEKFTDQEVEALDLGAIVVMHKPIYSVNDDGDGSSKLLYMTQGKQGSYSRWLNAHPDDHLNDHWDVQYGFAFAVL